MDGKARPFDSLILPRNFSVSTADRVRALIAGPPAYAVRRRRIEDLEASIARSIQTHQAKTGRPIDPAAPPPTIARAIVALRRLVEAHNAYYPVEANLPVDVATAELVELGERWEPMPLLLLDDFLTRART